MTITYVFEKNLYINLTNQCPNACDFCLRQNTDTVGDSGSLWLDREPTREEILEDIFRRDLSQYRELVFCGFGEPTCRLEDLLEIAKTVKEKYPIIIRVNTNGLSDLINGRRTAKEFEDVVDILSISLNASTAEGYDERCHPKFGLEAFPAILQFARQSVFYVQTVILTVVDTMPKKEIEECRRLSNSIGADFRVREYIP